MSKFESIYFMFVLEEGCLLCSSFQMFLPFFPLLMCVLGGFPHLDCRSTLEPLEADFVICDIRMNK